MPFDFPIKKNWMGGSVGKRAFVRLALIPKLVGIGRSGLKWRPLDGLVVLAFFLDTEILPDLLAVGTKKVKFNVAGIRDLVTKLDGVALDERGLEAQDDLRRHYRGDFSHCRTVRSRLKRKCEEDSEQKCHKNTSST